MVNFEDFRFTCFSSNANFVSDFHTRSKHEIRGVWALCAGWGQRQHHSFFHNFLLGKYNLLRFPQRSDDVSFSWLLGRIYRSIYKENEHWCWRTCAQDDFFPLVFGWVEFIGVYFSWRVLGKFRRYLSILMLYVQRSCQMKKFVQFGG